MNINEVENFWNEQKPVRSGKDLWMTISHCIQRQVPKKPVTITDSFSADTYLACPKCYYPLTNYSNQHILPPHCMMCGQKVDAQLAMY